MKGFFIRLMTFAAIVTSLIVASRPAESLPIKSLDTTSAETEDKYVFLPIVEKPCAAGALIFGDDFSDPNSGWGTWDNDYSQVTYSDGELRIWVKVKESRAGLANADTGSPYQVAATARNATGRLGHYGLLFGFEGWLDASFYTFEVSPAGNFYVYYHEFHSPDPVESTLLHSGWSNAIQTGMSSNRLAVVHRPDMIYFYANGRLVTTWPTNRTGSNQLGLWATSTSQSNLDVRFDDFEVREFYCEPFSGQ